MLGTFPVEIYGLISDHLQQGWDEDWENRHWVTWAGVCRSFRDTIQAKISLRIKINISDDDQDVFNLLRLQKLFTGPTPLIDTSKTREFTIRDNRFDTIWDPTGDESRCWDISQNVYHDSFLNLLSEGERIEDPTKEQCERSWKLAVKVFCGLFSNMVNLEILDWGATVPLTDAYEGPTPLCHAIPGSKNIAAQWIQFHKLKELKLNDRQITDPRFLLYMDTPDLEVLEIGSRIYGGSASVKGGIEYAKMTENQIKELHLFAEVESKMDQELYTFLRKCKKLKRFKVESFGPLQNPDCLPFWSVIDVEIIYWESKMKTPQSLDQNMYGEFYKKEYEIARAVQSFKSYMDSTVTVKGSPLTLDDLNRVLKKQTKEEIGGNSYIIDLFAPFREWIRQDHTLANRVLSKFNSHWDL